jgi:hypothetical protein
MRDYGSLPMRLRLVLDAKDLHMDSKPVFFLKKGSGLQFFAIFAASIGK